MGNGWIIETLATGDEIVNGDIVDSNSAFVSQLLRREGYLITRHNALPDDFELLVRGIQEIAERADVCICSGGLGPTEDDLTADVVAHVIGKKVVFDLDAMERMKVRFEKLGLKLTDNNIRSTRVPESAAVLPPQVGTAPAFSVRIKRCLFFFLPGVPKEYRFFIERDVIPQVLKICPGAGAKVVQLKTLNIPESHLAKRFEDYPSLFPQVKLGYRAHSPEVWLKLTASASTREEAEQVLQPAIREAELRLKNEIFGRNQDELPRLVHELLIQSGKTLSIAESCTGGRMSELLTANAGSSAYFQGAVVCYSNHSKEKLLGVPESVLHRQGAVSAECANALSSGALQLFGTDLAISITGIAGPGGGTEQKPVGLVWFSLARKEGTQRTFSRVFYGDRARVQGAAALTAIEELRRELLGLPSLSSG